MYTQKKTKRDNIKRTMVRNNFPQHDEELTTDDSHRFNNEDDSTLDSVQGFLGSIPPADGQENEDINEEKQLEMESNKQNPSNFEDFHEPKQESETSPIDEDKEKEQMIKIDNFEDTNEDYYRTFESVQEFVRNILNVNEEIDEEMKEENEEALVINVTNNQEYYDHKEYDDYDEEDEESSKIMPSNFEDNFFHEEEENEVKPSISINPTTIEDNNHNEHIFSIKEEIENFEETNDPDRTFEYVQDFVRNILDNDDLFAMTLQEEDIKEEHQTSSRDTVIFTGVNNIQNDDLDEVIKLEYYEEEAEQIFMEWKRKQPSTSKYNAQDEVENEENANMLEEGIKIDNFEDTNDDYYRTFESVQEFVRNMLTQPEEDIKEENNQPSIQHVMTEEEQEAFIKLLKYETESDTEDTTNYDKNVKLEEPESGNINEVKSEQDVEREANNIDAIEVKLEEVEEEEEEVNNAELPQEHHPNRIEADNFEDIDNGYALYQNLQEFANGVLVEERLLRIAEHLEEEMHLYYMEANRFGEDALEECDHDSGIFEYENVLPIEEAEDEEIEEDHLDYPISIEDDFDEDVYQILIDVISNERDREHMELQEEKEEEQVIEELPLKAEDEEETPVEISSPNHGRQFDNIEDDNEVSDKVELEDNINEDNNEDDTFKCVQRSMFSLAEDEEFNEVYDEDQSSLDYQEDDMTMSLNEEEDSEESETDDEDYINEYLYEVYEDDDDYYDDDSGISD